MCDILFVRSREARPTSVPPKIELWGDSQHCCPPSQNFGGDSPSLPPHDLRHCERLDQLAFDCRLYLDYLQGYSNLFCTRDSQSDSYPVIGCARSASWSCSGW